MKGVPDVFVETGGYKRRGKRKRGAKCGGKHSRHGRGKLKRRTPAL